MSSGFSCRLSNFEQCVCVCVCVCEREREKERERERASEREREEKIGFRVHNEFIVLINHVLCDLCSHVL